jgi:hypothetical protein
MCESGQVIEARRSAGVWSGCCCAAIQKQHMEMDIQVQCAAEALDQCDGAGL